MAALNFIVIGTTVLTINYAEAIIGGGDNVVGMISLPSDSRPLNSVDIHGYCQRNNIPYLEVDDINSEHATTWAKCLAPHYIVSAWPHILKGEIFTVPSGCIIGSHPTDLPYNRGRHPLHWLIVLGFNQSQMSFFRMDEGIDSGEILHKEAFEIGDASIGTVLDRMNEAAIKGLVSLIGKLKSGSNIGLPQDHGESNYWRKRSPHDSTIDPRLTVDTICRIVRSFSSPFPCSTLRIGDAVYPICASEPVSGLGDEDWIKRLEPGKVVDATDKYLIMKADDGLVRLESEIPFSEVIKRVKYIYPPTYYL